MDVTPEERAAATRRNAEIGLVDLHVDPIIQQRLFGYDLRRRHRAGIRGQPFFWHADLPRMRDAGYGGACLGIHYWPWESEGGFRELNAQIDYLDRLCDAEPTCLRVRAPQDWEAARAAGRLALAPGVEGAHMLNGRIERVAALAARGVAYLTLAHFSKNAAATPSMGRGANERDGLTAFGKELVAALNAHGVAVDVAHVNTPGVLDACAATRAPLLCTHTGVKGVYPHRRNITDEEIDAVAETGGVIGVMFAPGFLAGDLRAGTEAVLDHLEHIVQRAGIDHAALGSDYDGWLPRIPRDMRDCRDIALVTAGLARRGYDPAAVAAIIGGNARRVLAAAAAARTEAPAAPAEG